jgi:hypothetical protein
MQQYVQKRRYINVSLFGLTPDNVSKREKWSQLRANLKFYEPNYCVYRYYSVIPKYS